MCHAAFLLFVRTQRRSTEPVLKEAGDALHLGLVGGLLRRAHGEGRSAACLLLFRSDVSSSTASSSSLLLLKVLLVSRRGMFVPKRALDPAGLVA